MRDWYARTFGANPRETPNFAAADLPGVALNFTKSPDPVVGTQGRALDHIGFEVKNLEEFTKKLEAMGIKLERPYTKVPALNIAIAFIRDPWGTYIELTKGSTGLAGDPGPSATRFSRPPCNSRPSWALRLMRADKCPQPQPAHPSTSWLS